MPIVTVPDSGSALEMPTISLVVARSRPGNVIGRANSLPWHLKSDLRRFRAVTLDHAIVMGRRTFTSIGHPLPRRLNVVVSTAADDRPVALPVPVDAAPVWAADLTAAVRIADAFTMRARKRAFFVIGGSRLFHDSIDADLVDCVHLTEVLAPDLEGDAHFAREFSPRDWRATADEALPAGAGDEFASVYRVLQRARKRMRLRGRSQVLAEWPFGEPPETTSAIVDDYLRVQADQAVPGNPCRDGSG